jgi:hypothetical protein
MKVMFEKVKAVWKEYKEPIKTGLILVLTPVALMGLSSAKCLDNIISMAANLSEQEKNNN